MDAYFFIDPVTCERVLYVPRSFVARFNKGRDEFYAEFNPSKLEEHALSLSLNQETIIEGLDSGLIHEVDVDEDSLKEILDYCSNNQIASARKVAGDLFAIIEDYVMAELLGDKDCIDDEDDEDFEDE